MTSKNCSWDDKHIGYNVLKSNCNKSHNWEPNADNLSDKFFTPILSQTAKQTSQLHPMAEMKACRGVSCSLACAIEAVFAKKLPLLIRRHDRKISNEYSTYEVAKRNNN